MNRFSSFFTGSAVIFTIISSIASASPGHDHSHDQAPQVVTAPASPRFEAHSDLFEVVGILGDSELSIFVDRYSDNAPVLKAKVELESGSTKLVGQFHEEHGDYSFAADPFKKSGSHPITLTITAGDQVDMLTSKLIVADEHVGHTHADSSLLLKQAGLGIFGLAVLLALAWMVRRHLKRRNARGLK